MMRVSFRPQALVVVSLSFNSLNVWEMFLSLTYLAGPIGRTESMGYTFDEHFYKRNNSAEIAVHIIDQLNYHWGMGA